jgi:hypothetical protein
MSVDSIEQITASLRELVDVIRDEEDVVVDRWLGKRAFPRYTLVVPVRIWTLGEEGPGTVFEYLSRDISESGIGFWSKFKFEPGQLVHVELCANKVVWRGEMRVRHCTETISGYKVGLKPTGSSPYRDMQPLEEEEDDGLVAGLRRVVSLNKAKEEIDLAMRAYRLAQMSWGLLGSSVKKRIRRLVAELPAAPSQPVDACQRKHPRLHMKGDVHMLVPTNYGNKQVQARIVDVSEGGVSLLVGLEGLEDPVEEALGGKFEFVPQMHVFVGLGIPTDKVWVPAAVVQSQAAEGGGARLGVRFLTGGEADDLQIPDTH